MRGRKPKRHRLPGKATQYDERRSIQHGQRLAFACALVAMAVKKYLVIEDDQGTFTLKRSKDGKQEALSAGEKKIADTFFGGRDTVVLKQSNHSVIQKSISALSFVLR